MRGDAGGTGGSRQTRLPKQCDLAVSAIQECVLNSTTNPDAEYGVRLNRLLFS
jgi:hypothetical protein